MQMMKQIGTIRMKLLGLSNFSLSTKSEVEVFIKIILPNQKMQFFIQSINSNSWRVTQVITKKLLQFEENNK
jgi:hypothetical protein